MKMKHGLAAALPLCTLLLSGCSAIGSQEMSATLIYLVVFIASLCVLFAYTFSRAPKNRWYLGLLVCVSVINGGYFWLSGSQTLPDALMANRMSYLGSVFLPMTMLMIILNTCKMTVRKAVPWVLSLVAFLVFLVAASPGILDIYYKEVTLTTLQGSTMLQKVYGPWHHLYLIYLLGYFAAIVTVSVRAVRKKKVVSPLHVLVLSGAVLINMGVWLLEQLAHLDFELLSVSYLLCELFLLCFFLLAKEQERVQASAVPAPAAASQPPPDAPPASVLNHFIAQLPTLTPAERNIYTLYVEGKTAREVLAQLDITENTLKYHNRNIYSKLGVSSRKEMLHIARSLPRD